MDFSREANKLIRVAHAILVALFSAASDQALFLRFASSQHTLALYTHTPWPFKTQFHLQAAAKKRISLSPRFACQPET